MLNNRVSTVKLVILLMLFLLLLVPQVTSAEQADGEYTIGFSIMHADKKNASIAEGYWDQPAKLIIKDGNIRVQTTINKHAWVTEFATRYNGSMSKVKTISVDEAADERLTEFQVANITDLVESNVSVYIDHIDYEHSYTMYFRFKPDTLTLIKAAAEPVPSASVASPTASPIASPIASPPAAPTPAPTHKPAPTQAPAQATATPDISAKPSSTAAATAQVSQSPSPSPSSIPTPDDSTSVHTSDVEQNEEVAIQSKPSNTAKVEEAAVTDLVEMTEKDESKGNGTIVIVIVILVVLMALTAIIVYKTRQNKK